MQLSMVPQATIQLTASPFWVKVSVGVWIGKSSEQSKHLKNKSTNTKHLRAAADFFPERSNIISIIIKKYLILFA